MFGASMGSILKRSVFQFFTVFSGMNAEDAKAQRAQRAQWLLDQILRVLCAFASSATYSQSVSHWHTEKPILVDRV